MERPTRAEYEWLINELHKAFFAGKMWPFWETLSERAQKDIDNREQFIVNLENQYALYNAKNIPRMNLDEYLEAMRGKVIVYIDDNGEIVWEPLDVFANHWIKENDDRENGSS